MFIMSIRMFFYTNTYHQLNTNDANVSVHPEVGNTIFWSCQCQVPFEVCSVDTYLAANIPVLCTLEFIESLDFLM